MSKKRKFKRRKRSDHKPVIFLDHRPLCIAKRKCSMFKFFVLVVLISMGASTLVYAEKFVPYFEKDKFERKYESIGTKDFRVEDKNFRVEFTPVSHRSRTEVTLTNLSNKALTFVWTMGGYAVGEEIKGMASSALGSGGVVTGGFFPQGADQKKYRSMTRMDYTNYLILQPGKSHKSIVYIGGATLVDDTNIEEEALCADEYKKDDNSGIVTEVVDENCLNVPITLQFTYSTFTDLKKVKDPAIALSMSSKDLIARYRMVSRKAK